MAHTVEYSVLVLFRARCVNSNTRDFCSKQHCSKSQTVALVVREAVGLCAAMAAAYRAFDGRASAAQRNVFVCV